MADENTAYVKVSEDYVPAYPHVVLYDDYAAHPDAPVFITSKSTKTYQVAMTARVAQLINQGVLVKTKGKTELPVTDSTGEPEMNTTEVPEGADAPVASDNSPTAAGDGKTVQAKEVAQQDIEKAAGKKGK